MYPESDQPIPDRHTPLL